RHVNEILSGKSQVPVISKVTSLKYINPQNTPDPWEAAALRDFEQGLGERGEVANINGQPYMRLIRPFITEKACLVCHAAQGYKLGDIRGALSIGVPMRPYLEQEAAARKSDALRYSLIWIIGMFCIGWLGHLVQKALRRTAQERAFTETAVNTMQGTFFVLDEEGKYVRWNKAVEDALGSTGGDMHGRDVLASIHPDDRRFMAAKMAEVLEKGSSSAEARRLVNGHKEPRDYLFSARKMVIEGKSYVVGTGIDITDRKNLENTIKAASDAWLSTFDSISDSIMILDKDFRILRCNKAAAALIGKPLEEVLGRRCWEFMHEGRSADECPVRRMLQTGRRQSGILQAAGRTCLVTADPMFTATGEIGQIVHTIRDISEQEKLESQLHQAQKMEAIGALAGGIAHDFNNVLTAIVGFASILRSKVGKDDPLRQYVEPILTSTERATALTKSLLSFSRKEAVVMKPADINEIIRGFQKILARLIGEDIEFAVKESADSLCVQADKGQIEQVLMNLVTNARDAMPRGGRLSISTDRIVFEKENGDLKAGVYAMIAVSDTGSGIDKEAQEHIFEPFYTTKETGKGTGLGLSIVYGIIKKHNGSVHVYSEQGLGTTFKIFIPLADATPQPVLEQPDEALLPSGIETILLAEDDEGTRRVARVLLEEYGYTVLEAADGEAAVSLFRKNKDRVDLVLFDLIMPKKNGNEAHEEIRNMRPGIKAVFMSGYSVDIISRKGILEEGLPFLSKPISPGDLLRTVRKTLGPAKLKA
ncbi:MAG TPA: PAS domain-containing protein, partial [Nitrospirota bacterium]